MELRRVDSLAQAEGHEMIEVRDVGSGRYLLSISIGDEQLHLTGPFPSAEIAEQVGISQAEVEGVELLYIVHTDAA